MDIISYVISYIHHISWQSIEKLLRYFRLDHSEGPSNSHLNNTNHPGHLAAFRTCRQTPNLLSDLHTTVRFTSAQELKDLSHWCTVWSHFTYGTQTWHMSLLKPCAPTGQTTHAVLITVPSCRHCSCYLGAQLVFQCYYYSPISPWSFRSNSAYLSAKQIHTTDYYSLRQFILSPHNTSTSATI